MTLYRYLIVDLPIRDTSTHTYQTDPFDPLNPLSPGIALLRLGESVPNVRAINVWVYNFSNQPATIQLIANENAKNYKYGNLLDGLDYMAESAYPDYDIGGTFTAQASSNPPTTPSVVSASCDFFPQLTSRYVSISVTYPSAPSVGFIRAHVNIFYQAI